MQVTVIPADCTIICDGVTAKIKPWPFDDSHIHAIQWHHTEGELEFRAIPRPPNEVITDEAIIEPYIEAFNASVVPMEDPS